MKRKKISVFFVQYHNKKLPPLAEPDARQPFCINILFQIENAMPLHGPVKM